MSTALVALAAALLVAPGPVRRLPTRTPRRSRPAGPPRWLIGSATAAAAVVAATLLPITVVVAALLLAGTVTLRRRRTAGRVRGEAESAALQGALDVLAGELRAGAHPVVAFETAAGEAPDDVAGALRAVAARARLGVDVAGGLRDAAETSAVPNQWSRLAVCWELAHRHGLPIATLMRTAHREFVERGRFASRVDAGLAGARATAAVLAGLPVLGMALGELVDADPITLLCSGGAGGVLLVVGTALACAGVRWSDRITGRAAR